MKIKYSVCTEYIRKLSNFNFQWTKSLYQDIQATSVCVFTLFETYRCNQLSLVLLSPKTISYGSPKKIHFKFHQNWENTQVKLPCIRFHFVKFVFSGSKKNLFLRSYSIQLIALFYSPWKLCKRMQYAWNYSGTRFLSSFPNGFHVNYLFFCCLVMNPFLVKTCGMFPIQDNTPVTFTSSCKCLGRKIKIQIPSSVVK